tara:strand:+ start:320 stop:946 length:627 start_codon:yes stop_codon:yes gene_type:complete
MKLSDIKLNDRDQVVLTLTKVRIAFSANGANHFDPYEFEGKRRYGCNAILEDKHVTAVEKAMQLIAEKTGLDLSDLAANQKALRVGNKNKKKGTEDIYDGFEDKMYLSITKHAMTHAGKPMKPPVVYGADREVLTDSNDPRVKSDGAYANIQIVLYRPGSYNNIACSYDFLAYRNDEFEAFGGGGAQMTDESDMFEGTAETEAGEDEI